MSIKLLYCPWPGAEKDELYEAFSKKTHIHFYTTDDLAIDFKPDIIYLQSGVIHPGNLKYIKENTGATVVQWTGDYRPEGLPEINQYKGIADKTFLAGGLHLYKDSIYLPHPVGKWRYRPVKDHSEGVVMLANNYGQFPGGLERQEMVRMYPEIKVYGSGWAGTSVIGRYDNCDIYQNSYLSVGCNIYNDIWGYFSDRPLESMMSGCCFMMRHVPGLDFVHGVDCLMYKRNEEIKNLMTVDIVTRNRIARAGQKKVYDNYTQDNFVQKILDECSRNS